jgi:Methionyl-tRNA formyltransferase
MDAGLDTGDMLLEQALPIESTDTASTLHDKLAALGAALVVQGLDALERGELRPASAARSRGDVRRENQQGRIADAMELARRTARPEGAGVHALARDAIHLARRRVVKVGAAEALTAPHVGPPGLVRQMTAEGLDVGCGSGVLRITRLQNPAAQCRAWRNGCRAGPTSRA